MSKQKEIPDTTISIRANDFEKCMCLMHKLCGAFYRKEKFRAVIESSSERVIVTITAKE